MAVEKSASYSSGHFRQLNVVELTRELVRRPSDNGTRAAIEYIDDLVRRCGLETHKFPTVNKDGSADHENPNLLVGKGLHALPRVLFSSHIDTVASWKVDPNAEKGHHDPFAADIVDGRIIGRGASDSKGGAAAQLAALINRRNQLPNTCALLLTSREESDLGGVRSAADHFRAIEARNPGASTRLIFDSGSDSEYATGSRGVLEVEIVLEGRTGHTARPIEFANVAEVRDRVTQRIESKVSRTPVHPILGRATMVRTTDKSGFINSAGELTEPINQIPNWASMKLSGRLNGMPMDGKPLDPPTLERVIRREVEKIQPRRSPSYPV